MQARGCGPACFIDGWLLSAYETQSQYTAVARNNQLVLILKLCLKFRRFQIGHAVKPAGIELLPGGAKVPTQIPDTSRLRIQLVTLTVGVFLFGLLLLFCLFFCSTKTQKNLSALWSVRFIRPRPLNTQREII